MAADGATTGTGGGGGSDVAFTDPALVEFDLVAEVGLSEVRRPGGVPPTGGDGTAIWGGVDAAANVARLLGDEVPMFRVSLARASALAAALAAEAMTAADAAADAAAAAAAAVAAVVLAVAGSSIAGWGST